jgi:glycolate oxidase FAD binding subunit
MTPRSSTHASPQADLKAIVGHEHAGTDTAGNFAVEGMSPQVVVSPAIYEEIAAVLARANTQHLGVIPFGGGSTMHLGNVPARYDIALDMSRLNAVVEYEPADLTVTCQAGITFAALQARLAEAGQTLPLGPFPDPRTTIGGILAANRIGAYTHGYGRPRDVTIGMRIATADGRIARAGGGVVKNVAGYDMSKLHIGALGTLGVIVEATFKVAPLPAAEASCSYRMARVEDACKMAAAIQRAGLSVRAIEIVVERDACDVTLDIAGSPNAVKRSGEDVRAMASSYAAAPSDEHPSFPAPLGGSGVICRFGVLPETVPELAEALRDHDLRPAIVAWPTAGIVFASWDAAADESSLLSEIRALSREATMVIERCGLETKSRIDVFGPPPPSFPLMRAIKQQFDPNAILSPGRFVGRL